MKLLTSVVRDCCMPKHFLFLTNKAHREDAESLDFSVAQTPVESERGGEWRPDKKLERRVEKREACRFVAHVMNACWDNRCVVMSFCVCVGRSIRKVHSFQQWERRWRVGWNRALDSWQAREPLLASLVCRVNCESSSFCSCCLLNDLYGSYVVREHVDLRKSK